jgi:transcriptional regulator with XRE-family HTH domain
MDIRSPRVLRLRLLLGESQQEFAVRLGVSQPTVHRIENGQAETGGQRLLLDRLEEDIAAGRILPGVAAEGASGAIAASVVTAGAEG